jgi:hypothetical protein
MNGNTKRLDIRRAGKSILIGVVILFVINLAFYIFFIRPDRKKLDDLQGESAPQYMALESFYLSRTDWTRINTESVA